MHISNPWDESITINQHRDDEEPGTEKGHCVYKCLHDITIKWQFLVVEINVCDLKIEVNWHFEYNSWCVITQHMWEYLIV